MWGYTSYSLAILGLNLFPVGLMAADPNRREFKRAVLKLSGEALREPGSQDNISPEISWRGAPDGTGSLALTVTDPDAEDFLHWIVWNIPAGSTGLPEDVPGNPDLPNGARQGANEFALFVSPGDPAPGGSPFKTIGYDGPCPGAAHTYTFTLFALTGTIDLPGGTEYEDALGAIGATADNGSLIDEVSISGIFTPAG